MLRLPNSRKGASSRTPHEAVTTNNLISYRGCHSEVIIGFLYTLPSRYVNVNTIVLIGGDALSPELFCASGSFFRLPVLVRHRQRRELAASHRLYSSTVKSFWIKTARDGKYRGISMAS